MGKAARDKRKMERVLDRRRAGKPYKMSRTSRSYTRWIKSLQNMKVYDEYGFPYYAYSEPVLIHKGGKP